jgi:hypothetical protein
MFGRSLIVLQGLILSSLLVGGASGQQNTPRTLRFVSEWVVPPPQRAEYLTYLEKEAKPIFERMMKDGPVVDWGIYTTAVYDDNGPSNGYWFECKDVAGIDKVLRELDKIRQNPINTSDFKHHDYLLRSVLRHTRSGDGADGVYYFNSTLIQPGKKDRWRAWWDKYQKPMYDQFLADGLVSIYEIEAGEIHTMDPNWVYLMYVAPNAESIDKINAAFEARGEKRNSDESRAISDEYDAVVVAGSHRDYLARATSYGQK